MIAYLLIRSLARFGQHLQAIVRSWELIMGRRLLVALILPKNRLVEAIHYTRRLTVNHPGLIHSKILQTRIVPITSQSRGRSDRQGGQSGDNNI